MIMLSAPNLSRPRLDVFSKRRLKATALAQLVGILRL